MAQLRQQPQPDEDGQQPTLSLMIRPWVPTAVNENVHLVLGDATCPARACMWVEISYGLNDIPLTYLRHLLQLADWSCTEQIERLRRAETHYVTWRSACPPALLMARPGAADEQGKPTFRVTLQLTAAGLSDSGPESGLTFVLDRISSDELLRFGQTLDQEIRQALNGQPPNPEIVPPFLRVHAFSSHINVATYNTVRSGYTHDYLTEPFFRKAFESWLGHLPGASRVLEIGCGHGEPIATALAARGHQVTGIDPSAGMIAQAQATAAHGDFQQLALAELNERLSFNGACSFFSLLCMDPIELRIGLGRLHSALQPDAPLLIVSGVPDLYIRTSPLRSLQGHPTWEWSYDHQDMTAALTERQQWEVVATDLQYYHMDSGKPVELETLPPKLAPPRMSTSPTDDLGLTVPLTCVYALIARKRKGG